MYFVRLDTKKKYFDVKTAGKRVLTTNFDIRAVIYRGCIGIFCENSGVFKFWIILGGPKFNQQSHFLPLVADHF